MSTAPAPARRRRTILLLILAAVIIAVALLASLLRPDADRPGAETSSPPGTASAQPQAEQTADGADADDSGQPGLPDLARRDADDVAAIGPVDAPVVLIEYADYRCPYCGVFTRQTLPQLVDEYVERGKLRVEWRDTPIFGEDSMNAAVAARAAGEQGLFWQYNHAVYEHQGDGRKDLPRQTLLAIAEQVGVADMAAFTAGLDDPRLRAAVAADAQEAQALGVQSTPAFLVGRTPLMGALPVESFREVIDLELDRAKG